MAARPPFGEHEALTPARLVATRLSSPWSKRQPLPTSIARRERWEAVFRFTDGGASSSSIGWYHHQASTLPAQISPNIWPQSHRQSHFGRILASNAIGPEQR